MRVADVTADRLEDTPVGSDRRRAGRDRRTESRRVSGCRVRTGAAPAWSESDMRPMSSEGASVRIAPLAEQARSDDQASMPVAVHRHQVLDLCSRRQNGRHGRSLDGLEALLVDLEALELHSFLGLEGDLSRLAQIAIEGSPGQRLQRRPLRRPVRRRALAGCLLIPAVLELDQEYLLVGHFDAGTVIGGEQSGDHVIQRQASDRCGSPRPASRGRPACRSESASRTYKRSSSTARKRGSDSRRETVPVKEPSAASRTRREFTESSIAIRPSGATASASGPRVSPSAGCTRPTSPAPSPQGRVANARPGGGSTGTGWAGAGSAPGVGAVRLHRRGSALWGPSSPPRRGGRTPARRRRTRAAP